MKGRDGGKEKREERRRGIKERKERDEGEGEEERERGAHRSCGFDSLFSEEHVDVLSHFIH